MRTILFASVFAIGLVSSTAYAEPAWYRLDPVHTRVMFAVSHAGFSDAIGTVSGSEGELLFDPDDWSVASIDVRVPIARADLGDAQWNAAVLGPRLLAAKNHPQARFVSEYASRIGENDGEVCGHLTLRGSVQPLCLRVRMNQIKRHPMPPFRRTAGFSATAELSRKAFGIDTWAAMIGDTVHLRIEAEAVLDKRRETPSASDAENLSLPVPPASETTQ